MAAAIAGPSVINGDSDTARPAFRPRASVSETTRVSSGPGESPPLSPNTIAAVTFEGLNRTPVAVAEDVVRVRAGDRLDTDELDRAVTRLLRTGRFLAADYRLDDTDAGVRVTFELRERLIVSAILF